MSIVVRRAASRLVWLAALVLPLGASAQSWEYKSYKKSLGGQYSKENFVVGTISLEEKDGKATLKTIAGAMDSCRRAELPAQVAAPMPRSPSSPRCRCRAARSGAW